jgi:hypothetical protein
VIVVMFLLACGGGKPDERPPASNQPVDVDTAQSDPETGTPVEPEGWRVDVSPVDALFDVDECAEFCAAATVRLDGEPVADVEVDLWVGFDCIGADLRTDDAGRVESCSSGLEVGEHPLLAVVTTPDGAIEADSSVRVHPFGYGDGIVRDTETLGEMPYVPEFVRSDLNPVLSPGSEGSFDSGGTMLPSVVRTSDGWTMWYAGTQAEDYAVGVATSADGETWVADAVPALPPSGEAGSWKRYATNSPMIVQAGDEWRVYYTGRAEETGDLTIGLAVGSDSVSVSDVPENPVFTWTEAEQSWAGTAVAHPAVVQHPDGHFEMLYSSGYHKLGHAYSLDGITWKRYCNNPVFTGRGADSWEQSLVKSADLQIHDGLYLMTYTGGDRGNFKVGFAMSRDGLHWERHSSPVLGSEPTPGTWESNAVLGASIAVDGETLRMWYAGTGMTGSAIGMATADLPAEWGTP